MSLTIVRTLRDARSEDLGVIAEAVAEQPLMVRYGNSAAGLERALRAGLGRGDEVILVEEVEEVGDGTGPGEAVGMAWFQRSGTFALGGYLRLIAVFPGRERAGLGALLMDEVERRTATESRHLFLLVSAHNEEAQRFYARRGYVSSGRLPALVRPDIDELILWRRL